MSWHVRKNRSLHEHVLALTLTVLLKPRADAEQTNVTVKVEGENYWRAEARYGFMEQPDIPAILNAMSRQGRAIDVDDVTYYVGHETIVPREDGQGLPRWQTAMFAYMGRNAARHQRLSETALRPRGGDRPRDRNLGCSPRLRRQSPRSRMRAPSLSAPWPSSGDRQAFR